MLPETISYHNNATKCIIILAVGSHEGRAVKRLVYIYAYYIYHNYDLHHHQNDHSIFKAK